MDLGCSFVLHSTLSVQNKPLIEANAIRGPAGSPPIPNTVLCPWSYANPSMAVNYSPALPSTMEERCLRPFSHQLHPKRPVEIKVRGKRTCSNGCRCAQSDRSASPPLFTTWKASAPLRVPDPPCPQLVAPNAYRGRLNVSGHV